jgi:hypothetical protein
VKGLAARILAWGMERSGLPRVAPEELDAQMSTLFAEFTAESIDRRDGESGIVTPPGAAAVYLRHLARERAVLFHGSKRGPLAELRPERESGDTREFGRQQAVYASHDPLWSMFFAVVNRDAARSIRNGSVASVASLDRRRYFLSVGISDQDVPLATPGWLYVVPAHGFVREPPLGGMLDTGQWVSRNAVRPIAAIAVAPEDFPLRHVMRRHEPNESMLATVWRSRRS